MEAELDEDIQTHLRLATEENLRRGMSPADAQAAARRSFGSLEQIKEEYRDQRGIPVLETLAREVRFAGRSLLRAPGFTAVVMLTLAFGIGINVSIFNAVNALLLRPPGVARPDRVVAIRAKYDKLGIRNSVISLSDFKDVREGREIFSAVAVSQAGDFTYDNGTYPRRLAGLRVSWQWFEVLGTRPALGRLFTAEEDQPNNNQSVILSYLAWQRLFGGNPSVVGNTIQLNQIPYKVVGVMGMEQNLGGLSYEPYDVFVPLGVPDTVRTRFNESYIGLARLQPGISFSKAQTFMGIITERGFQAAFVGPNRKQNGRGVFLVPYRDFLGGSMNTPMLILWAAVALVLVIACSDIAGLTLARASTRTRELAVRATLGGTWWHLIRQTLAESLLLAAGGSIMGVGVA
jgi:predicted permease